MSNISFRFSAEWVDYVQAALSDARPLEWNIPAFERVAPHKYSTSRDTPFSRVIPSAMHRAASFNTGNIFGNRPLRANHAWRGPRPQPNDIRGQPAAMLYKVACFVHGGDR